MASLELAWLQLLRQLRTRSLTAAAMAGWVPPAQDSQAKSGASSRKRGCMGGTWPPAQPACGGSDEKGWRHAGRWSQQLELVAVRQAKQRASAQAAGSTAGSKDQ